VLQTDISNVRCNWKPLQYHRIQTAHWKSFKRNKAPFRQRTFHTGIHSSVPD